MTVEANRGNMSPWQKETALCPISMPPVKDIRIGMRGRRHIFRNRCDSTRLVA
jgi:hypothetical protein